MIKKYLNLYAAALAYFQTEIFAPVGIRTKEVMSAPAVAAPVLTESIKAFNAALPLSASPT